MANNDEADDWVDVPVTDDWVDVPVEDVPPAPKTLSDRLNTQADLAKVWGTGLDVGNVLSRGGAGVAAIKEKVSEALGGEGRIPGKQGLSGAYDQFYSGALETKEDIQSKAPALVPIAEGVGESIVTAPFTGGMAPAKTVLGAAGQMAGRMGATELLERVLNNLKGRQSSEGMQPATIVQGGLSSIPVVGKLGKMASIVPGKLLGRSKDAMEAYVDDAAKIKDPTRTIESVHTKAVGPIEAQQKSLDDAIEAAKVAKEELKLMKEDVLDVYKQQSVPDEAINALEEAIAKNKATLTDLAAQQQAMVKGVTTKTNISPIKNMLKDMRKQIGMTAEKSVPSKLLDASGNPIMTKKDVVINTDAISEVNKALDWVDQLGSEVTPENLVKLRQHLDDLAAYASGPQGSHIARSVGAIRGARTQVNEMLDGVKGLGTEYARVRKQIADSAKVQDAALDAFKGNEAAKLSSLVNPNNRESRKALSALEQATNVEVSPKMANYVKAKELLSSVPKKREEIASLPEFTKAQEAQNLLNKLKKADTGITPSNLQKMIESRFPGAKLDIDKAKKMEAYLADKPELAEEIKLLGFKENLGSNSGDVLRKAGSIIGTVKGGTVGRRTGEAIGEGLNKVVGGMITTLPLDVRRFFNGVSETTAGKMIAAYNTGGTPALLVARLLEDKETP